MVIATFIFQALQFQLVWINSLSFPIKFSSCILHVSMQSLNPDIWKLLSLTVSYHNLYIYIYILPTHPINQVHSAALAWFITIEPISVPVSSLSLFDCIEACFKNTKGQTTSPRRAPQQPASPIVTGRILRCPKVSCLPDVHTQPA